MAAKKSTGQSHRRYRRAVVQPLSGRELEEEEEEGEEDGEGDDDRCISSPLPLLSSSQSRQLLERKAAVLTPRFLRESLPPLSIACTSQTKTGSWQHRPE